jgi:hypothetical protein
LILKYKKGSDKMGVGDKVKINWDKVKEDEWYFEYIFNPKIIEWDKANPIHIITGICYIGHFYTLDNTYTIDFNYVDKC